MADINGNVKRKATLVANTPQKITFSGASRTATIDAITELTGTNVISFAINRNVVTAGEDVSICLHEGCQSFSDWNSTEIQFISVCSNVAATIQWVVR